MGINIIAIFPIGHDQEEVRSVVEKLEQQAFPSIQKYSQSLLANGFSEFPLPLQWTIDDTSVESRPELPSLAANLELPSGIILRFREDSIALWSSVRAFLAVSVTPEIGEAFLEICQEIGKALQIKECWIMGDDNPIYHAFHQHQDFKRVAESDLQQPTLQDIYHEITKGEFTGCYEIKGHYRLQIEA